jgi:hypothetical protein
MLPFYSVLSLFVSSYSALPRQQGVSEEFSICVIPGFRREVGENFALLGYYAAR